MKILIVADSRASGDQFNRALSDAGYPVEHRRTEQAVDDAALNRYDVILLEWSSQGPDGAAACQKLRRRGCNACILVFSDRIDVRDKVAAFDAGADDCVVQPVDPRECLLAACASS